MFQKQFTWWSEVQVFYYRLTIFFKLDIEKSALFHQEAVDFKIYWSDGDVEAECVRKHTSQLKMKIVRNLHDFFVGWQLAAVFAAFRVGSVVPAIYHSVLSCSCSSKYPLYICNEMFFNLSGRNDSYRCVLNVVCLLLTWNTNSNNSF